MLKNKTLVNDAVHIRGWLQKLNRGSTLTVIPGSPDHAKILHLLQYVERDMLNFLRNSASPARPISADAKPSSIEMRLKRQRETARITGLVEKYFEIHGDSDG